METLLYVEAITEVNRDPVTLLTQAYSASALFFPPIIRLYLAFISKQTYDWILLWILWLQFIGI